MPKRPLTQDEQQAAAALAAAISKSDLSQEAIADAVGVSQGMVWQWANGRLPVPSGRAVKLAKTVSADPAEISVAFRNIARQAIQLEAHARATATGAADLTTGPPAAERAYQRDRYAAAPAEQKRTVDEVADEMLRLNPEQAERIRKIVKVLVQDADPTKG